MYHTNLVDSGCFPALMSHNKSELFQLLIMPKKTYVSITCQPNSLLYMPTYWQLWLISVVKSKHFSCLTPVVGLHFKTGFPYVSLAFILFLINFVKIVTLISKPFYLYLGARTFDLHGKFCSVMYSKKKGLPFERVLFPFRIHTCVPPPTFQNLLICSFIWHLQLVGLFSPFWCKQIIYLYS